MTELRQVTTPAARAWLAGKLAGVPWPQRPDQLAHGPFILEGLVRGRALDVPGRRAHRAFAPQLAYGRHDGVPGADARPAAVAIPVAYRKGAGWSVLLTRRGDWLPHHAGQWCFPGGGRRPGEPAERCAERELYEEVGVSPGGFRPLCRLTPLYVFASNYFVQPCVLWAQAAPPILANPQEVAETMWLPFAVLLDHRAYCPVRVSRGPVRFDTPALCWGDRIIWGATLLMLGELAWGVARTFRQHRKPP